MSEPAPEAIAAWMADHARRFYFVGIGGAGMSALAAYRVQGGGRAAGSDRFFDLGRMRRERARCERVGIEIFAQDGSGPREGDVVIASTAVESTIADVVRARELGLPVVPRPALLAACVRERDTVAIAGSSGKSSVVAMTFEALVAAGRDPGVLSGGDLLALRSDDLRGNAWRGTGPLVIEADESDKSLVRYRPRVGVVLNLHRDHDEPGPILAAFETFRGNVTDTFVTAADDPLPTLLEGASTFAVDAEADLRPESYELLPDSSRAVIEGTALRLPVPGRHNLQNALAALAACRALGVPLADAIPGLEGYRGVGRRFEIVGSRDGVEVIDDFAHNPAKVAATVATMKRRCDRLVAIFQPHGYGPLKFMREALVDALAAELRGDDVLVMVETFYAGGSATRDVEAVDVARQLATRTKADVRHAVDHDAVVRIVDEVRRAGTSIVVMGARDPDLPALARRLV